jgi:hypothetical protein
VQVFIFRKTVKYLVLNDGVLMLLASAIFVSQRAEACRIAITGYDLVFVFTGRS